MKVAAKRTGAATVFSREVAGLSMHPALLLTLCLLALPAGAEVTVHVEGPDAPVQPAETVNLNLEVAVDCLTLWSRQVVTVQFDAEAPELVDVFVPPEAGYGQTDCPTPDGNAVKTHVFRAVVGRQARAGEALPVHLSATVPKSTQEPEQFGVAQVDLVPAYDPGVTAMITQQTRAADSSAATYAIKVTNVGNDDAEVTLRVVESPGRGGVVELPDPMRVPMGKSMLLNVTLRFDHDNWEEATARISFESRQAETGAGEKVVHAEIVLRNSPATQVRNVPITPLLPPALLGAAVALRKRS